MSTHANEEPRAGSAPPARHDHGGEGCCAHAASEPEQGQGAPSAQAIDPVCGMQVDPNTSRHRADHAGKLWHFCSAAAAISSSPNRSVTFSHNPSPPHPSPRCDLHLPDASGDPASRPGQLSQVRHGAGAAAAIRRCGRRRAARGASQGVGCGAAGDPVAAGRDDSALFVPLHVGAGTAQLCAGPNCCCRRRWCCGPALPTTCAAGTACATPRRTCIH